MSHVEQREYFFFSQLAIVISLIKLTKAIDMIEIERKFSWSTAGPVAVLIIDVSKITIVELKISIAKQESQTLH